jgi:hypothetical protein
MFMPYWNLFLTTHSIENIWILILKLKITATYFGSLKHHQAKYKTRYQYLQWVRTHWMYQYCVLYLAWWWFSEPKHFAVIFNFNIYYQYSCVIDWINYYIIAKHNGMAPIKNWISLKAVLVGTLKHVTLHYTQVIPSKVQLSLDALFDCKWKAHATYLVGKRITELSLNITCQLKSE